MEGHDMTWSYYPFKQPEIIPVFLGCDPLVLVGKFTPVQDSIALKDNLRKLKGKAVVDEAAILHLIDPELLKVDVAPLAPKLQNNKTAYSDYLNASGSQPSGNTKKDRIPRPLNSKNTVKGHPRNVKHALNNKNHVNASVEEPEFKAADKEIHQDQGNESGHSDDQPDNRATPQHD
nr:hypothetical protein [Tanacetum cinerariifolium]